jgi:hypothetical protein
LGRSPDDLGHHLTFARRERFVALAQLGELRLIAPPGTALLEPELDRVEQVLIAERFDQELDRTRPAWRAPSSARRRTL